MLNRATAFCLALGFSAVPIFALAGNWDRLETSDGAMSGQLVWIPIEAGLSRFQVILPEIGISEALTYGDTSALFYLGQIKEQKIAAQSGAGALIDANITPESKSLTADWIVNEQAFWGLGLAQSQGSFEPLLRGKILLTPEKDQLSQFILTLGSENRLEWRRAKLNQTESYESINYGSVAFETEPKLTIGYARRHWNILEESDFAWSIGLDEDHAFGSAQLEFSLGEVKGFARITSAMERSPTFTIGLILTGKISDQGRWNLRLQNSHEDNDFLTGFSLGPYRHAELGRIWLRDSTIDHLNTGLRK